MCTPYIPYPYPLSPIPYPLSLSPIPYPLSPIPYPLSPFPLPTLGIHRVRTAPYAHTTHALTHRTHHTQSMISDDETR